MNRACTFISMHPSNIIFFPLLFCRKSLTRWKCLRHCHKSHNVSPHTASDFLAQGLGQLLGRCAQETSDLFVTKATTTSQCRLHLVEMHIWYLKKNKTIQFFAPGSGGPAVWGIGMFAGKIGHQEYSTEKGSPEVNEPNTTGNLHLSRDKQRCWHSLHYDSMKILMWAARLKAVMPGACTIKNKTIWKFYGKKMVR